MSKTRYVKTSDGKFAGSIGAGKTTTPTSAPHLPQHPQHAPTVDAAVVDAAPQFPGEVVDYCTAGHSPSDTENFSFPGKPDADALATWPVPHHQKLMDTHIADAIEHLDRFNNLTHTRDLGAVHRDLDDLDTTLGHLSGEWEDRADYLRDSGLHHQAYAAQWTAMVLDDAREHLSMTLSNVEDDEHLSYAHPQWTPGSLTGDQEAECFRDCGHTFAMDALRADAARVSAGAVICDLLPTSGYDVEAAAVLSALTPSPWTPTT